jgi:hypothetical protein
MKNRIAILIVISVVLVMALSACGAVKDVSTVNDLGKSLMTAFRDGDAVTSWDMLTADVQTEVGSSAAWKELSLLAISRNGVFPTPRSKTILRKWMA